MVTTPPFVRNSEPRWASLIAQLVNSLPAMQETLVLSDFHFDFIVPRYNICLKTLTICSRTALSDHTGAPV